MWRHSGSTGEADRCAGPQSPAPPTARGHEEIPGWSDFCRAILWVRPPCLRSGTGLWRHGMPSLRPRCWRRVRPDACGRAIDPHRLDTCQARQSRLGRVPVHYVVPGKAASSLQLSTPGWAAFYAGQAAREAADHAWQCFSAWLLPYPRRLHRPTGAGHRGKPAHCSLLAVPVDGPALRSALCHALRRGLLPVPHAVAKAHPFGRVAHWYMRRPAGSLHLLPRAVLCIWSSSPTPAGYIWRAQPDEDGRSLPSGVRQGRCRSAGPSRRSWPSSTPMVAGAVTQFMRFTGYTVHGAGHMEALLHTECGGGPLWYLLLATPGCAALPAVLLHMGAVGALSYKVPSAFWLRHARWCIHFWCSCMDMLQGLSGCIFLCWIVCIGTSPSPI